MSILEKIRKQALNAKHYHLLGIAGVGMRGIAWMLRDIGAKVTGSDLSPQKYQDVFESRNVIAHASHDAKHVEGADAVVMSTAIPKTNPERQAAESAGIPIFRRAEILQKFMSAYPEQVAVAGSHGKTTCSALLVHIFEAAGQEPSYFVGSDICGRPYLSAVKEDKVFVAETDESDGTLSLYTPTDILLTNIENEHMDYFKDTQDLLDHFTAFCKHVTDAESGILIANQDDPYSMDVLRPLRQDNISYFSIIEAADYRVHSVKMNQNGSQMKLDTPNHGSIDLESPLIGTHNVYNVGMGAALGLAKGLSVDAVQEGVRRFHGTKRRLEKLCSNGITVFDDYAHHPTEVQSTLSALRRCYPGRIIAVFQPHRYSRTTEHFDEFLTVFNDADHVVITDIYAASEANPNNMSGEDLQRELKHKNAHYQAEFPEVQEHLLKTIQDGDIIVMMGAGTITQFAHSFVDAYHQVSLSS